MQKKTRYIILLFIFLVLSVQTFAVSWIGPIGKWFGGFENGGTTIDGSGIRTAGNLTILGGVNNITTNNINVTGDITVYGNITLTGSIHGGAWNKTNSYIYPANDEDSVGVGMNDPSTRLEVLTNFSVSINPGDRALFHVASNGNVGSGTATPNYQYHIKGGTSNQLTLSESTDAYAYGCYKDGTTSTDGRVCLGALGDALFLNSNGGTTMYLDEDRDVGIGTTSTDSKFEVESSTAYSAGNKMVLFDSTSNSLLGTIFGVKSARPSAAGYKMITAENSGGEIFTVRGDGKVGINSDAPARSLDVYQSAEQVIAEFESGSAAQSRIDLVNTNANALISMYANGATYDNTWGLNDATGFWSIALTQIGTNDIFKMNQLGDLFLGRPTDGVDHYLKFLGNDNNGTITWMEDQDRFEVDDETVFNDYVGIGGVSTSTPLKINKNDFNLGSSIEFAWSTTTNLSNHFIKTQHDSPTTANNKMIFEIGDATGASVGTGTDVLTLAGDGEVGIGITNPGHDLEIYDSDGTASLEIESDSGAAQLRLDRSSTGTNAILWFRTAGSNDLFFGMRAGGNDFTMDTHNGSDWRVGAFRMEGDTPSNTLIMTNEGNVNMTREVYVGNITYQDTYWDDVYVPVTSAGRSDNPPSFDDFNSTTGTKAYAFDNAILANQEKVFFTYQNSHRYKLDSLFEAHLHTSPSTNDVCNATFELGCDKADIGNSFESMVQNVTIEYNNNAYDHIYSDFNEWFNCTDVSCVMQCRLERLSADATDNCDDKIFVHAIDYHIEIDSPGSRDETVK